MNCVRKISLGLVNKGMWWENCFCCARESITEYNKVAWCGKTSTTLYNILEKRNVVWYNIYSVKKFDRDQTSYKKIQHDTTRYNTIQHNKTRWSNECKILYSIKVCMLLYEILYLPVGRGFKRSELHLLHSL